MDFRFIGEEIKVEFDEPPQLEKKPHCPDRILRSEQLLKIEEILSEWQNFERRGSMSRNMRPENLQRARKTGSWGVGRFFFRVRLANNQIFDIYYDRAPQGTRNRKGTWHLYREILDQKGDRP
ncbi:MAG: hypothetical protein ACI9EW_000082 [Cellvibrionaceae bacterium]|jgi:hypothetical protein